LRAVGGPYLLRRILVVLGVIVLAAGIAVGGYFGGKALFGNDQNEQPAAPAPRIVLRKAKPRAASDLGFPAFATKNTTRVGGTDEIDDAAGVALASYPSTGGVPGPAAVTLVPVASWQDGVAAASLVAAPVGAPELIGAPDAVPPITAQALETLSPAGSGATGGAQIFALGSVLSPNGAKTKKVLGSDPATVAAAIARLRAKLAGGPPEHIVVTSSTDAPFAMPAAAWAARSGDPVLFAGQGPPPLATLRALHHFAGVPVYVLGPPTAVSDRAFALIKKVAPSAKRVGGDDPVANAVDFARYVDGTFGWNINDPGHGFVVANAARPLDAGAAAALSAAGTFGPMLLTSSATTLPPGLRSYLLDLKPGYENDPTRAVYNHVWVIGDANTISVALQAQLDDLAQAVKIGSASSSTSKTPPPSKTEPNPKAVNKSQKPAAKQAPNSK
jgi:hypothetical protein